MKQDFCNNTLLGIHPQHPNLSNTGGGNLSELLNILMVILTMVKMDGLV
jgi:hypothetical protein